MFGYVLFISVIILTPLASAESFLANGDFERGTGVAPEGWSRSFWPQGEGDLDAAIGRSSERVRSGEYALKVDTASLLGRELTLVFNGAVRPETTRQKGRRVRLRGWVYVEPGMALRPLSMRLRMFGVDDQGRGAFLDDVFSLKVLGEPGRWTPFHAEGTISAEGVQNVDLHCAIRPDIVPTVQYLDDLRLELVEPPLLAIRLPHRTFWSDEPVWPVQVDVNRPEAQQVDLELHDPQERIVQNWERPPQSALCGLELAESLPEGSYSLHATLRDESGSAIASAQAELEVVESPWMDAPPPPIPTPETSPSGEMPEGFRVLGTLAPTGLPDALPGEPEPVSPDVDLTEWEAAGYVAFTRRTLKAPSRAARPRPGEIGPVRLFASPGEYEPAALLVWALRDLHEVRVSVDALKGEAGAIPTHHVDVCVVRTIEGLPPFLERRPAVDIPHGETRTFWLTLHVPPDARPGFYFGSIRIAAAQIPSRHVPLLLRVLPLRLPPPPRGYGFWWKMDARWDGYGSKERETALEQIRNQFVMLREHGCNMLSVYSMPKMTRQEDGTVAFDFAQDHWGHNAYSLTDLLRLGRETHLFSPEVPLQYVGADSLHTSWIARALELDLDSPAFDAFYRDACRRIDRWAKERRFTLAFACVDEIGNSEGRRRDALRFYHLAQEAGTLTSVTDNSMHGGVHLMGQERFDAIIAMRMYNFITPEMIEHTHRSGDHVWLYNLASGGWDGERDRFVVGLFTERCGAEGYAQWAFQWPKGNMDPYEAAAQGTTTGYHYALPAPDGPLPTLALEGFREGIDDARYLALLSEASRTELLEEIDPMSPRISEMFARFDPTTLDARRWQVVRWVDERMGR